ncbi:MAG: metal-dependent transcriptional regulator [Bacillota bacterium]
MKDSVERYLQIIYTLSQKATAIKSIEVGNILGVTRSEVFRALKTLKLCGYINQKPYGKIELTEKGKQSAERVATIHLAIKEFFVDKLFLDNEDAEANAYKIEHNLSDTAIEKIVEYYKNK